MAKGSLLPLFSLPLSGDVRQRILPSWFSPTFNFDFQGDVDVETEVVREVASYGSQLGTLIDAVLVMARDRYGDDGQPAALRDLADLQRRVEAVKARHGYGADVAQRLAALEKENAALKAEIATMKDARQHDRLGIVKQDPAA